MGANPTGGFFFGVGLFRVRLRDVAFFYDSFWGVVFRCFVFVVANEQSVRHSLKVELTGV